MQHRDPTAKRPLYEQLAIAADALAVCQRASYTTPWEAVWQDRLEYLAKNHMPSGSGFDCGTRVMLDECSRNKLVFITDYHHMDQHGGYSGWTTHKITIRPSFIHGFDIVVGGRDRNDTKDYIAETMAVALKREVEMPHHIRPDAQPGGYVTAGG